MNRVGAPPGPRRDAGRVPLLVAFIAVQFCPWFVATELIHPTTAPRNLLFRAVVAVAALGFVLAPRRLTVRPFACGALDPLVAALCMVTLVSSWTGVNVRNSLWGDFERMDGAVGVLTLSAYYFLLTRLVRSRREWNTLFTISLFIPLVMSVLSLPPVSGLRGHRVTGMAGNPMNYAGHLLLCFVLSLAFASGGENGSDAVRAARFEARVRLCLLIAFDLVVAAWFVVWHPGGPGVYVTAMAARPQAAIPLLALHIVVIAAVRAPDPRKLIRGFHLVAAGWFALVLCLTQTRGALLAAVVAVVCVGGFRRRGSRVPRTAIAGGLVGSVMVFALLAFGSGLIEGTVFGRMANLSFAAPSVVERVEIWRTAVRAICERPLLGWGPENFAAAFDAHMRGGSFHEGGAGVWVDRAHSMFLQTAVTSGLTGLGLLVALHIFVCRNLMSGRGEKDGSGSGGGGPDPFVLCTLVLAHDLHALVGIRSLNSDIPLFTVFAYAGWLRAREGGDRTAELSASEEAGRGTRRSITGVTVPPGPVMRGAAAFSIIAVFYAGCLEPWRTNSALSRANAMARTILSSGQAPDALPDVAALAETARLYRLALGGRFTGRDEARREYANHVLELSADERVPSGVRLAELRRMFVELDRGVAENPNRAGEALFLAMLTNRTLEPLGRLDPGLARGRAQRGLEALEQAERLNPTRPEIVRERESCVEWLRRTDPAEGASLPAGFQADASESSAASTR